LIHPDRVQPLNARERRGGRYVLYWMQQSQRARGNPALEHAVRTANDLDLPVLVAFGLTDDYPEANARHYAFMLEGLRDVARDLRQRRIGFVVRGGSPEHVAIGLSGDAAVLVCDRGYLRHQRAWRQRVAEEAECPVVQVEGDVVVPVEAASNKREFAARTIRPKLHRRWDDYLQRLSETEAARDGRRLAVAGDVDVEDVGQALAGLRVDRDVRPVARFEGGNAEARRRLTAFLRNRLDGYDDGRNEPADWHTSMLSPYLHFGQISPVDVVLAVRRAAGGAQRDAEAYVEELVVRRELAVNYVHFCERYDEYGSLPEWATKTLAVHADDAREHRYTRRQLDDAATHDRYWNAAMLEMRHTGFLHNYMRMYWGKKILEWSSSPQYAFRTALYLNNRYLLDGRDPNSYAGVAWCFGLHDRPWTERKIFGSVRYMNDRGLERKFDMERYVAAVERLVADERGSRGA